MYLKLNQIKEAEKDFNKVVMITPNFKPAYDNLIRIYEYKNDTVLVNKYKNMVKTLK